MVVGSIMYKKIETAKNWLESEYMTVDDMPTYIYEAWLLLNEAITDKE